MPSLRSYATMAITAGLLSFAPRVVVAQASSKIDVSGKWAFTVTTSAGTGTPTVTLKQQGDSLTGHYSSQALGEADLTGTVREQRITFAIKIDVQGNALVVTYTGTVENADSLKGTVDLGGMGTGTFTAKRQ
jgi:hypothetical protein